MESHLTAKQQGAGQALEQGASHPHAATNGRQQQDDGWAPGAEEDTPGTGTDSDDSLTPYEAPPAEDPGACL